MAQVRHVLSLDLDLTPFYVWTDGNNDLFAMGSLWMMAIREGWESVVDQIVVETYEGLTAGE